jgi:leader peptidase (prepilin peptidase)/N-methyltransferase
MENTLIFVSGIIILGFILGAILGSFISMASWRMPRKESWGGRSRCPACGRTLGVSDLVPIVSYFLKGKKCTCGAAISVRYPIIEIATGALCAIVAARFGLTLLGALSIPFVVILMLMIVIDWEHFIIPDPLVVCLFLLGLVWRWGVDGTWYAPLIGLGTGLMLFLTAFLAAYIVERMNETESLGGGDLKLLFAAGPWIGFHMVPVLLFLSGVYGLLFYLLWKNLKMPAQQSADVPLGAFPYGPAICAAIFTCVLSEEFVLKLLPL